MAVIVWMTILCTLICALNAKPANNPKEKKQYDTGEAAVYRLVKVQFIHAKMFGSIATMRLSSQLLCVHIDVNIDSMCIYNDVSDFVCVFQKRIKEKVVADMSC